MTNDYFLGLEDDADTKEKEQNTSSGAPSQKKPKVRNTILLTDRT